MSAENKRINKELVKITGIQDYTRIWGKKIKYEGSNNQNQDYERGR